MLLWDTASMLELNTCIVLRNLASHTSYVRGDKTLETNWRAKFQINVTRFIAKTDYNNEDIEYLAVFKLANFTKRSFAIGF